MMPAIKNDIRVVQRCYPQIYLACHADHIRAASTPFRLSAQDSSILVHLDSSTGISPRQLATHLGVRPSTLSAAIKRLEKLGYLFRVPHPLDRRSFSLRLTEQGAVAMSATSVLDSERVAAVLKLLSRPQRRRALQGLQLLAKASLQHSSRKGRKT